ncbi:AraC-type DNA-binding protein [Halopseudomonas salegens]|uniref:AraC-type DNA-binding protein n=2 Tax=Halopseudomonas salegens TaxID=1434072 RepID=A0A1H2E3Q8_9GAMM|nr:AraC-type DNA-binding protein [Halopseudomonas salegens]
MVQMIIMKGQHQPREQAVWMDLIGEALSLRQRTLLESTLARKLLTHLQESDSIDQSSCNLLWEEALQLSGDDWFGLQAGLSMNFSSLPLRALELTAAASADVAAALASLARFFELVSAQARAELTMGPQGASLRLLPIGQPHPQHMQALLGMCARLLESLGQSRQDVLLLLPAEQVLFERRQIAGLRLQGGDGYALQLPRQVLDCPLPDSTPVLLSGITGTLRNLLASMSGTDLVERVRHTMLRLLSTGRLSEVEIAAPMNISTRHLRRLLKQQGASYEQLLDQVRREESLRLLQDSGKSLTSIAYELGFHEPSSFTRAFRRWTGISPSEFRRRQQTSQLAVDACRRIA